MDFTGTWRIVSSPDFDADYLSMEVEPFVSLEQNGNRVTGEYQAGLQSGGIDGKLQKDGTVAFSFEGMDEMKEVTGRGSLRFEDDRLLFTLDYHFGDTYAFECVRTVEE